MWFLLSRLLMGCCPGISLGCFFFCAAHVGESRDFTQHLYAGRAYVSINSHVPAPELQTYISFCLRITSTWISRRPPNQISNVKINNPFAPKVLPISVNVNSILPAGALWSSLPPVISPLVTALHPTASFLDLQTPRCVPAVGLVCSVPCTRNVLSVESTWSALSLISFKSLFFCSLLQWSLSRSTCLWQPRLPALPILLPNSIEIMTSFYILTHSFCLLFVFSH